MFFKNTNVYGEGKGVDINGEELTYVNQEGKRLTLNSSPSDLITENEDNEVSIEGRDDIVCIVSRNRADQTMVFSIMDADTSDVLESVDIPNHQFFKMV